MVVDKSQLHSLTGLAIRYTEAVQKRASGKRKDEVLGELSANRKLSGFRGWISPVKSAYEK